MIEPLDFLGPNSLTNPPEIYAWTPGSPVLSWTQHWGKQRNIQRQRDLCGGWGAFTFFVDSFVRPPALPALQLSWHQAGLLDEVSARGYRTSGGPADTGESAVSQLWVKWIHLSWKDDGFHICLCRHFSTAHVCSGDYFIYWYISITYFPGIVSLRFTACTGKSLDDVPAALESLGLSMGRYPKMGMFLRNIDKHW